MADPNPNPTPTSTPEPSAPPLDATIIQVDAEMASTPNLPEPIPAPSTDNSGSNATPQNIHEEDGIIDEDDIPIDDKPKNQQTMSVDELLAEEREHGFFQTVMTKVRTKDRKAGKKEKAEVKENLNKDGDSELPPVKFLSLFQFADRTDKILIVIAIICSVCHGALTPMFTIIFGDIVNALGESDPAEFDVDQFLSKMNDSSMWFVILGALAFLFATFQVLLFMMSGARQANRIRKLYINSIFRQEMAWFDSHDSAVLTSRVASDVNVIADGIGDKVGSFIQFLSMFITGFAIGFAYGWKLTLVILSITPAIALSGAIMGKLTASATTQGQEAYARAGGIAGEALSLIRTVVAFGGEEREIERYEKELQGAFKVGVRRSLFEGLGMGATFFCIFSSYALGFWYGGVLVRNGDMSAGDVLTVFFSVVIGAMGLGQGAPAVASFTKARGAAPRVFQVIKRVPEIDSFSLEGKTLSPEEVQGKIEFRDVKFTYKSRPNELILDGLNLTVDKGQTLALVGPSGCGKSTTIQLMERFYDVLEGGVFLDGVDIREINVQSLRSQIGLVSQMPTLFAATIRKNIELGAGFEMVVDPVTGEKSFVMREVSFETVMEAAKQANAHDFISKLPEGYDTMLGQRGALLSGGQKQRIAIARALVRNPKILLLDESTSALDSKSEGVVQEALNKASQGRTTIMIAHRLSTVRDADMIAVFDQGSVAEIGNHDELLKIPDGRYQGMINLEKLHQQEEARMLAEVKDGSDDEELKLLTKDMTDESRAALYNEHKAHASEHHSKSDHHHTETDHHMSVTETMSKTEQVTMDGNLDDNQGASHLMADTIDKGVTMRALKLNTHEWYWIVLGGFGAACNGVAFPSFALIFAEMTVALTEPDNESEVQFWALMFVVIAAGSLVSQLAQLGLLGLSGEILTKKLRSLSFRALLRQEIGFFDVKEHSVGALTTSLATDTPLVNGIAGSMLGTSISLMSTLISGMVISFVGCWKLAFVVLAITPAMVLSQALQMKLMTGFAADSDKQFAEAGRIASEAADNVRTVTSLGLGRYFCELYREELKGPAKNARKESIVSGVVFGFSEFMQFAIWALSFWYGGKLVSNSECDFLGVMQAISALLFAAMQLGMISAVMPNVSKAKIAATRIFRLIDRKSEINAFDPSGDKISEVLGNVEFEHLKFEYPTRKEIPVLRDLSVSIGQGKTLALVGESGCGKSTLISLVERFYNVRGGRVLLDGKDVTTLNLKWLRSQIGIVSQEPDLFNTTVRENILYGFSKEEMTVVTEDQIVAAARLANAEDFINKLPGKYDSEVGERGSKISGGQRQRIAIARAMVRNPTILLLDEATSALDGRSQKVVQAALDAAAKNRTTIVIAHRLSTIQDADCIAVLRKGRVVELGTHSELVKKQGIYAHMVKDQAR
mmetsp:Transcript_13835/g.23609  ORF Transcript_13835/g.23609 Transcript_13835/m.23609 type:complete len:1415 (+) Transcript_13835:1379-5623(+)|eukprot:CAMPEP_0184693066 /NCGR_PEP_ID=MMETSP0313-20130426/1355_1 /TAXON_ID=2792 /ORGANISM="Porphyridium aerugineum, Strain SAG 1380-2" /LENGTH=1414 /DNA_ID=CAMNT_0027151025 /DNA_START=1333 /DNA_END=5577 /DNA_ORIENTATION=+